VKEVPLSSSAKEIAKIDHAFLPSRKTFEAAAEWSKIGCLEADEVRVEEA